MARNDTPTDAAADAAEPARSPPQLPESLAAGFVYLGTDENPEMRATDGRAVPSSVVYVYARPGDPNHQLGIYVSESFADEGYPWAVAKNYVNVDAETGWKDVQIAETLESAAEAAEYMAERRGDRL